MTNNKAPIHFLCQGDVLIAESGHNCLEENQRCTVHRLETGQLYIMCNDGIHIIGMDNADCNGDVYGFTRVVN